MADQIVRDDQGGDARLVGLVGDGNDVAHQPGVIA
jgi:hypothetical protein